MRLLRVRAAAEDQFGGDLGPGAERSHADIATAQLLADHHHRRLGEAEPAEFFRDRQAEDAKLCQFLDDLHRDQLVPQVPAMRVGHHLVVGIAAELVADHLEVVVESGRAEGRAAMIVAHQHDQRGARLGRAARRDQGCGRAFRRPGHAKIGRPRGLPLAHRDAAGDLGEVFAEADLKDQRLHLAEPAFGFKAKRPGAQLLQRLDIGGEPGQRVGGELMLFERCA